jgi:two-component system chemotaxis response regulator CheY
MRTALIIEDDTTCAEMLEMILLGIPDLSTRCAANAVEARRLLSSEEQYAIVITDVHLPGEDGLSIVESMRKMPTRAALPVLVTTSSSDAALRRRAGAAGVAAFIEKPYSPARMREAVNSILNGT